MMGESVEDLLAQMKAKYGGGGADSASAPPTPPARPPQASPPSSPPSPPAPADSIDDLLSEIEGKPAAKSPVSPDPFAQTVSVNPSPSPTPSLPPSSVNWQAIDALAEESSGNKTQADKNQAISRSNTSPPVDAPTQSLLQDLKTQHQERERAEALKRQEQLQAEQRRQEQLKRQKRAAVTKQAEDWLKQLDPRSGEAVWFEEFAVKYESRVDAAIDYLGLADS